MRSFIAAVVIALTSAGCFTMKTVTLEDVQARPSPRIWVTRPDQSTVLMEGPQLFRGKLVGFVEGKYQELPSSDLSLMRVRRLATAKTLGLVGAGIVTFGVVAALMAGSQQHFDACAGAEDEEDDACMTPGVLRSGN